MQRFNIALHKKEQKEKREKQVMKNRRIQELDEELRLLEEEIKRKEKSLKKRRAQSRRLDSKIEETVNEVEELREIRAEQLREERQERPLRLSPQALQKRQKNKTDFINGKITVGREVAKRRRQETFQAAEEIHGGKPTAEVGLVNTVMNRCGGKLLEEMVYSQQKSKKIASKAYKKDLKEYEDSIENMCRSVAVYYSGGG